MLAQRFLVYSYQPESQRVGCRRDLLRPSGDFTETKSADMFRLRSDIFRLRTDKFRLRNDFHSPGGSQAVEIVGARNVRFRSFVRFQGVTPAFFSRFLFRRPFSEPPVRPSLNLVSQNSSIARIRF